MAKARVHFGASVALFTVSYYVIGFFVGFILNLADIVYVIIFGVLIDVDHMPLGRLFVAFKTLGMRGVLASWKKEGWLNPTHLNFMHTWTALLAVIGFTFLFDNFWPLIAYVVHILIDGGSENQEDYPKCSPMASDIHSIYPKWARYRTPGVPIPPKK